MVRCFGILCFKQKTAYEMRISDWSSDVCSSDLFLLDLGHRLDLVREPCGIHELGIDFGEIHHREIKARKLVDGEAQALLALRRAPRPAELAPSLLLKNTAEFTLERSEEHTSELQSIMRISYAVFCLKKKKKNTNILTR